MLFLLYSMIIVNTNQIYVSKFVVFVIDWHDWFIRLNLLDLTLNKFS